MRSGHPSMRQAAAAAQLADTERYSREHDYRRLGETLAGELPACGLRPGFVRVPIRRGRGPVVVVREDIVRSFAYPLTSPEPGRRSGTH